MTTTATSWIITLEEDPETKELLLPIPTEILEMKQWKEGDTLDWSDNKNGSWTLSKVEK